MRVVAADLGAAAATATADALRADGASAVAAAADVTDVASVAAMVGAAVDAFGGLDVLVNNAAAYAGIRRAPFWRSRRTSGARPAG